MSMEKKKRFRAGNFSTEEVRLLIRLAFEENHVLENKQTDSEVRKLKSETWERIAEVFNASSGQTFRSVDTLRLKYESVKKDLKKKVNKNEAETMKTGGGNPNYIVIDGPEKELLEVLSLSVHGLASISDSDTMTGEKEKEVFEEIPVSEITDQEIEFYDNVEPVVIDIVEMNNYPGTSEDENINSNTDDVYQKMWIKLKLLIVLQKE
ncbi:unnamed protein product [Phaedon cochleariae]|uniref:Regulatory protein zeste n=1 Tax=Phaedon cochleariae TaxID=80249 RepID=A0A9N9SQI2_PHACE|nr:unnamed protein product [Phaedon cochleariae]